MYLLIISCSFLFLILPQFINSLSIFGLFSTILMFIFTLYYIKSSQQIKNKINTFMYLDILLVTFGGISTFYISFYTGHVIAAGIIGFTSFLIGKLHPKLIFIQFPIFCGSFVGMTTPLFFTSFWQISIASIIAGFLYIFLKNHFLGYGGKLGSIAFTAVFIILVIKGVLNG